MEPVFTSLGARAVSLAAGPLVRKVLVAHTPGATPTASGTPLARRVAWGGKQRTITERDVRRLVGQLVTETLESSPELRHLRGTPEPLVEAVCRTLLRLGNLNMDDVQAVSLRHDGLARRLKEADPETRRELSEDFTHLYDTIIDICCLHILEFFSSRPEFTARTQIETVGMLHAQDQMLLSLLERLPDPNSADTLFEDKYAKEIVRRYDELTIFGIDLANSRASWPLDTAYLSLEAIQAGRYHRNTIEESVTNPGASDRSAAQHLPERVERALAGRHRVLMRGVAGSGKTTLLHWLATTAARRTFTDELAELNIFVPFVLPLRTLARDRTHRLPTPDQFLHAVDNMQAGAQPSGWANRIMEQGRGLLLIDGVDEVGEAFRSKTKEWLQRLLKSFPHTRCIVTARPSAIAEGWLRHEEFTELSLSPMRPQDVRVFVRRWHDAAKGQQSHETHEEIDEFATSLIETIDTKPDVARLTTNPLMCALVCALHHDKRGRLPKGRKALYDAALRMLLVERDDQRLIESPEGVTLDEDDQILLLEKIAYWLIRNGLAEVEKEIAMRMVEGAASRMPSLRRATGTETPNQVFNHLVTRSGLLREPSIETIEFLHRTFQDYLGARAAVENEDIPYLVQQAHNDQWEDVIRMAVSHCRPKERARLLKGIIERGDREVDVRHRLYVLAFVCLEHAPELDPSLQDLVEERAGRLLPPSNLAEAEAIAQVGPVLLELLPDPTGLSEPQACAAVHAASLIGGNAAMRTIAKYASDRRNAVQREIVSAWGRFDASAYAELVLARGEFSPIVTSIEQATACHMIPGLNSVACVGDGAIDAMVPALPGGLKHLTIVNDDRSTEITNLSHLRGLQALSLSKCRGITDIQPIVDSCHAIKLLYLEQLSLTCFDALASLTNLYHLTLWDNQEPLDVSEFPVLPTVMELSIYGYLDVTLLRKKFPHLRQLELAMNSPIGSLEQLGKMPNVRSLQVLARDQADGVTRGLHNFENLQTLSLQQVLPAFFGTSQLKEIVNHLPKLTELHLSWDPGQLAVVDVSYLSDQRPELTLTLSGAHEIRGTDAFKGERLQIQNHE
ncbi:NACHT domain-containing protein [Streptomyces sp. NPDC016675]|uniref:NACHT N-terminal Helical domain 1-containing protein n=1 Tax=Streptomyces sp. NPDC016675 TaxID=3364970 RepID=UPI0036F730B5